MRKARFGIFGKVLSGSRGNSVGVIGGLTAWTCVVLWAPGAAHGAAAELVLAVQPILDEAQTHTSFDPLCQYLSAVTGRPCRVFTSPNFLAYWQTMLGGKSYNLALDAAHFTDYRVGKFGFSVLAKAPDTVTYSLVVQDKNLVLDPAELVGQRVATLGIPSIGAARLNGMFPHPARQPIVVEVGNAEEGMNLLLQGKVSAAILPTPIIGQFMANGSPISVVLTTEPIPHIALSAAPSIDDTTRELIRRAMIDAPKSVLGRKMLKDVGFERFDPATPAVYAGQAKVLREYSGY
jgi:phosphonate transport system substrate-binding protein